MTLKEMYKKQFAYCKAIAEDIIECGKTKEVQEYAKKYAEIVSPWVGGTGDKWIRIHRGDIYIFLHDDGTFTYQLDPLEGYGDELIDVSSEAEFWERLDALTNEEIINARIFYAEPEDGDYAKGCPPEYTKYLASNPFVMDNAKWTDHGWENNIFSFSYGDFVDEEGDGFYFLIEYRKETDEFVFSMQYEEDEILYSNEKSKDFFKKHMSEEIMEATKELMRKMMR